jgi:hypothetical protein
MEVKFASHHSRIHSMAEFIPWLLTNYQKEQYSFSQELLHRAHFINIVKGNETWVYGCDTEMTRQSSQGISEFSSYTPSLLKH